MRHAGRMAAGFCWLASIAMLAPGRLAAQENSSPPAELESSWETIVLPVRYKPATDLANSLARIFQNERNISVSADTVSNALLIRTTAARKAEILELLATLDRRPRLADITLVLLQADPPLEDPGALSGTWEDVSATLADLQAKQLARSTRRLKLTALENEKAMLQIGETRPVVIGSARGSSGSRNLTLQNREFGTLLALTMRCPEAERLLLEVKFELSEPREAVRSGAAATDDAGGEPPASDDLPGVGTMVYESVLELPNGSAKLVQQTIQQVPGAKQQALYLIVAATLRAGDSPPQAAQAFSLQASPPNDSTANLPALTPDGRQAEPPDSRQADPTQGRQADPAAAVSPHAPAPDLQDAALQDAAERTLRFARAYLLRYDRDGSGALEQPEWAEAVGMNASVDQDGNQAITTEEVAVWLEKNQLSAARPEPPATVERGSLADYTLQRYDADQSGALERSEWADIRPSPANADTNRDQVITKAELDVWLRQNLRNRAGTGAAASPAAGTPAAAPRPVDERFLRIAAEMFKKYDRTGDGQLDASEQAGMPRPPRGADTDGDGLVTPLELAAYYQRQ